MEDRLAEQIDALRHERQPAEPADTEEAELLAVARAVKRLRKPANPSLPFVRQMLAAAPSPASPANRYRKFALSGLATLAAAAVFAVVFIPFGSTVNVVQAMEQKIAKIDSYHAVIEKRFQHMDPKQVDVKTEEVWYAGQKYAGKNLSEQDVISDGDREWTVDHQSKSVFYDYPMTPELHPFHPSKLLYEVDNRTHTIEGEDEIAGRRTTRVRFDVPHLKSYHLWIDNETKLPLQKQMYSWSGTVSTTTYKTFELNVAVDVSKFAYTPPADYDVIELGQRVTSIEAAAAAVGFQPVLPRETPKIIVVHGNSIRMGFGDVAMEQAPARDLRFDQRVDYGWTGHTPVHAPSRSELRWNQGAVQIHVHGTPRSLELARQIAPDLIMPYEPYTNPYLTSLIEEPVKVDMEAALAAEIEHSKNPFAHADRNYTVPVAARFIGEFAPIDESQLREAGNNGAEAIVVALEGPISKVYLRRVVRQEERGLWWVIGYDRR